MVIEMNWKNVKRRVKNGKIAGRIILPVVVGGVITTEAFADKIQTIYQDNLHKPNPIIDITVWDRTPYFNFNINNNGFNAGLLRKTPIGTIKLCGKDKNELGIYYKNDFQTKIGTINFNSGVEKCGNNAGETHIVIPTGKNNKILLGARKDKKNTIVAGDFLDIKDNYIGLTGAYGNDLQCILSYGKEDLFKGYLKLARDLGDKENNAFYLGVLTLGKNSKITKPGLCAMREGLPESKFLRNVKNNNFEVPDYHMHSSELGEYVARIIGMNTKDVNWQDIDLYLTRDGWKWFDEFIVGLGYKRTQTPGVTTYEISGSIGVDKGPAKIVVTYTRINDKNNLGIWARASFE